MTRPPIRAMFSVAIVLAPVLAAVLFAAPAAAGSTTIITRADCEARAGGCATPAPVAVSSRRISYGGPQTITCFQGGQIVLQHVGATFVRSETTRDTMRLTFKVGGQRRKLTVPVAGMSCLIEDYGEESVPIVGSRP